VPPEDTPADEELSPVDPDETLEGETPEDKRARLEADAAAAEAGRIGGRSGQENLPESERAPAEAGGGVSEGFEQSEELLREQAQHGDSFADPLADRPAPEGEGGRDHGEYAEADQEKSSEDSDDR
jgi:hypothetical protein